MTPALGMRSVGLTVRTAPIYQAADPSLEGRRWAQLLVFRRRAKPDLLLPHWFHQCFVPEVRRHLASKRLPCKVLLIVAYPGHPRTM